LLDIFYSDYKYYKRLLKRPKKIKNILFLYKYLNRDTEAFFSLARSYKLSIHSHNFIYHPRTTKFYSSFDDFHLFNYLDEVDVSHLN
jgi:hypothetical protein